MSEVHSNFEKQNEHTVNENNNVHNNKLKKKKLIRKSDHFSKIQLPLEMALRDVTLSSNATKRWIKLCLSYAEFVAPSESLREPARLMRLLSEHTSGLRRGEILSLFYDQYKNSSVQRQESFRICLEKIVQRARTTFSKYDLTIYYCKDIKKYIIAPIFKKEL
ncbi:hypothetical protein [Silvanigrella aquatica]|uniref:Uncharacterized protein n=1 Tax=Silvanigrella aquatica TaxID=1915309 RepID=A0A1L4D3V1_9BACT|nr:hypothetical protein [Silvanigrella aquatica]APJ04860.1 hypothetical protein AXG55_13525 [Silvanigrella aquatica]